MGQRPVSIDLPTRPQPYVVAATHARMDCSSGGPWLLFAAGNGVDSPSARASSFPSGRRTACSACGIVRLQAVFPPLPCPGAAQTTGAHRFSPSDAANGAPDRKDQTRFDPLAQMRRSLRHSAPSAVAQDLHYLEPTVALAYCLARIRRARGKDPEGGRTDEAATMTAGTWNCAEVCSVRFACLWPWKSTAAEISSSE